MTNSNPQARGWLLTLPAAEYDRQTVERELAPYPYVGQLEEGSETAYRHWQIYIENPSAIRFSTLRRAFPKGHFEQRRGSRQQAYEYCTKAESRVVEEPPLSNRADELDLHERRGQRRDIEQIHTELLAGATPAQVRLNHPAAMRLSRGVDEVAQAVVRKKAQTMREVRVTWVYGEPGVGKTSWLFTQHDPGDLYRVTDYEHPFDEYEGEDVIALDEYAGQIPFSTFLNLADRYPQRLPARYRDRWALHTSLVIISNDPPWFIHPCEALRPAHIGALRRRVHVVAEMLPGGRLITLDDTTLNDHWGRLPVHLQAA